MIANEAQRNLSIENASYCLNNRIIFQNVSLHLNQNESVLIWGANGSGKSTFLQCIVSLKTFTSVRKIYLPEKICLIPSDPLATLFPWYSVQSNIKIFTNQDRPEGFLEFQKIFKQKLDLSSQVHKLSTGQQVLVILYCLLFHSGIVLLDEVLSFLSHDHKSAINDWIERMKNNGSSLLIVSHDYSLASQRNIKIYNFNTKSFCRYEELSSE